MVPILSYCLPAMVFEDTFQGNRYFYQRNKWALVINTFTPYRRPNN
jgi:hypothetical protein